MVRRLTGFIILGWVQLISTNLYAATHFNAEVSTNNLQYGKSFTLILTATGEHPALNTVDLDELEKHFNIDKKADVEFAPDTDLQQWKLRLSPYQPGKVVIPAILFNHKRSQPITIHVSEPIDSKTRTPIKVTTRLSSQHPWLREQIIFNVSLQTQFPRAQMKLAQSNIKHAVVQQLDIDYRSTESQTHHYNTGWALFPFETGKMKITLPPVQLIRDGVTTHRFYIAPFILDVQPLPLYIPATISVGNIHFESTDNKRLVLQNSLTEYSFSIIGNNILSANLPSIGNLMSSTGQVRIYPEIRKTLQINSVNGIVSRAEYRFPIKLLNQGYHQLNTFKLSYFDTATGTLKTRQYPGLSVIAISPWLAWLLAMGLALLLFVFIKRIAKWGVGFYRKLRLYLQAITLLKTGCSPEQLKTSISLLSRAEGHTANITVNNWINSLTIRPHTSVNLRDEMNTLFYRQRQETAPQTIRQEILKIAYSNLPIIRIFNKIHPS